MKCVGSRPNVGFNWCILAHFGDTSWPEIADAEHVVADRMKSPQHPRTMPRDQEEDSSASRRRRERRRRGRDSTSSSPEPYRERRRSKERRRTHSRGSHSRSRERDKDRKRYSYANDRPGRDRSRSPRRRHNREYDGREGRRSSRERDEYRDSHSTHARRSRQDKEDRNTPVKGSRPLPSQLDAFKGESTAVTTGTPPEKQKANFSTTGRLAAESNTIKSVDGQAIVLKYHEPPEARKPPPSQAWRMYVFKGSEIMDTIELSQRSCWLFGREAAVVDFLVEHPSCSKQHAVIQFRYIEKRNEFGDKTGKVRPYLIDLETVNGTSMNGEALPGGRYMELRDKDVLKFGHSTREYVIQLPG
jgi:smad nuclear-interacting protein 1